MNLIRKKKTIVYPTVALTLAYYFLDKHSCSEYDTSGRGR